MGRRKAKPSDTSAAETQPAPLSASVGREQVVFARAHRHAGVDYLAGDSLHVSPAEAALLRQFDVVEDR